MYHTLVLFSTINTKDLIMRHAKFQICILKVNTIFDSAKQNPITFEQGFTCMCAHGLI